MALELGPLSAYGLVFCRVGCCLMLVPGYSSPHVPMQVRLYLALALSTAITPMLASSIGPLGQLEANGSTARLIAAECLAGGIIGVLARCLYSAVQLALNCMAQMMGFSGMASVDDGSGEVIPELGAPISAAVVTLLFVLDFHVELVLTLIESYAAMPFGIIAEPEVVLARVTLAAADALRIAVRVASPFLAAAILINLAFGIVNKIAPMVPVFFISAPFLILTAFWLIFLLCGEMTAAFASAFLDWLSRG